MKRTIKRLFCLMLVLSLGLELLPARALAATDELLRYQFGFIFDNSTVVIAAEYDGTAYVMGAVENGRGAAVEADQYFTTVHPTEPNMENPRRFAEVFQSRGACHLTVAEREPERWSYDYAFSAGDKSLTVSESGLGLSDPGTAPQYWKTGLFEEQNGGRIWKTALNCTADETTVFLVLHVGDGDPYFTTAAALGENDLPCETALREECCHQNTLARHEGVAPTCTQDGTAAYWTCSACESAGRDFRFLDEKGVYPFWNESELAVPAVGHSDANGDGVCDFCEQAMPVFTRVTMPSQIQAGLFYLLATEINGDIRLMSSASGGKNGKDDPKGGKEDEYPADPTLLPAVSVPTDESGAIRYADMNDAGAILLRLSDAAPDGNLDAGECRYTVTAVGGETGVMENQRGMWQFTPAEQSKYGWRVKLNEDGTVRFMPVEGMPPEFDWLHAYETANGAGFSIYSEQGATQYGVWDEEGQTMLMPASYPVYLYIMSGQDVAEYDYTLTAGDTVIDYENAAGQTGFDADAAARCRVDGLLDAVTDRTVRACIDELREETGSTAQHYNVTAFAVLTASANPPADADLLLLVDLKLRVSAEGEKYEDVYFLSAGQLGDAELSFVIYSWFEPRQLSVRVTRGEFEGDMSYRSTDDPLQQNLARPFAPVENSAYLVSFRTDGGEFPTAVVVRKTAVTEAHDHVWGDLKWGETGEWRVCETCGERSELTAHSFAAFEENSYASWNVDHVFYTIDPTRDSPGTRRVRCGNPLCRYELTAPIDPNDNWLWLVLKDEYGDPIPAEYIADVCWSQNDRVYQDINSQKLGYGNITGLDPNFHYAWHYPQHIAGEHIFYQNINDWDREGTIKLTVRFTKEARLKYVVPWDLTFDELVPGEPVVATLKVREGNKIKIRGRFPQAAVDSGQRLRGKVSTVLRTEDNSGYILDEEHLWNDVTIESDGSFYIEMPYGPTRVKFETEKWGDLTFENVQTMERGEDDVIDLGELDIRNRNGQQAYYTRWYSEEQDGAEIIELLNALRNRGGFAFTNDDTDEAVTNINAVMPEDPAENGGQARLAMVVYNNFEVGSHVTMRYAGGAGDEIAVEPISFVLPEWSDENDVVLDLDIYRRSRVRLDSVGERPDWRVLFDSDGNLISQTAGTEKQESFEENGETSYRTFYDLGYLDPGAYTLFLYQKNNNIAGITAVDEMERLEVPEGFYDRVDFTVGRGETLSLTPQVPSFNPTPDVVLSATCENSLRTDDAVPIYVTYRACIPLGEESLVFQVFGDHTGHDALLPLVQPDGQHYASVTFGKKLLREEIKLTEGGYHYQYLELETEKTHNSEGTIVLYARPNAGNLYIRYGNQIPVMVSVQSGVVTAQEPFSLTSSLNGNFVYFANLPQSGAPYQAAVYVNGRKYAQPGNVSIAGRGANTIPYKLTERDADTLGEAFSCEVYAEITHMELDPDTWEKTETVVWRSESYPVTWQRGGWPEPESLRVVANVGGSQRGSADYDMQSSNRRMMGVTFFPRDFNADSTINSDLIFYFALKLKNSAAIKDGAILLNAYCNDTAPTPTVRATALKYNEYLNVFEGEIVMDANSCTIADMPFGYDIVYGMEDETGQPDVPSGVEETIEALTRRLADLAELGEDERIESVDMDELEFALENSEVLEPYEKQLIRIYAAYQNELSDIQAELLADLRSIPLFDGITLNDLVPAGNASVGDVLTSMLTLLNSGAPDEEPLYREHLGEAVSEERLAELGYQCAELGGERGALYLNRDAATGVTSVVLWREREHIWRGSKISPLSGAPGVLAAGDGMTAESLMLYADDYAYDPDTAIYNSSHSTYDSKIILASRIFNDLLANIEKMLSKVKAANARRNELNTVNNMIPYETLRARGVEANTHEAIQKLLKEQRHANQAALSLNPTKTMSVSVGSSEISAMAKKMSHARKAIQSLQAKKAENLAELKMLGPAQKEYKEVLEGLKWMKGPKMQKLLKGLGLGAALLGVISDAIAMYQTGQEADMESYNADLEVHWAYDKFLALRESDCAATPELSEQQQTCFEAYKDFVDVERSKADWYKRRAIYKLATLFAGGLTAIATVLMPASEVTQLADLTVWTANNVQDVVTLSIIITTNWSEEKGHEKVNRLCEPPDCGSSPGKSPEQDPPTRTPSVPAPTNPVIDPSGYAYEAVASNRVEGVTATIYYRDGANAVPWEDASLYDQVSEQTTGADGRYEWMTPPGDWLVKLSKEGYAPADSTGDSAAVNGWLPVPPPQMNVNIAMTADAAPEVRGAWIGADRARVVFSQYMTMDSADAVTVTKNGDPVSVNAAFADREESPTQPGVYYGRVLELYGDFAGDGYAVSVTTAARNYAGTPLAAAYESGSLSVGRMVGALTHAYPNRFVTDVGDTETLVIAVSDIEKRPIANVPVTVRQGDGGMLRFAETAVNSDANGNAVFTVTGIAAGSNELTFTAADAVSVTMNTRVKPLGTESPKKPTANLSDRQTVEAGTALTLSCATEDAVIYYTTDDTCPCTESENRQVYTGPIPVMRTTLFRVASWTASGGYSERLNLRVVVDRPAPTVTLTQDGLTVSDLSEGVVPVAGCYNAAGQLVGAAYLTDGTLRWDAQPERVCVFFLDENGRPLYPAWHQAF